MEEDEKITFFSERSNQLKNEMMAEEKGQFYHIVWNSFISELNKPKTGYILVKESYKEFKKQLLETVDEEYVQQS